jgi:hypothetical protein
VEYSNLLPDGYPTLVCFLSINKSNLLFYIDVPTFDLGQNMAGLCRLRFNGTLSFGTYIHYGEVLTKPDIASK